MTRFVSRLSSLLAFALLGCGNPIATSGGAGTGSLSADPTYEELGQYLVAKGAIDRVGVDGLNRFLLTVKRADKDSLSTISVSKHTSHAKAKKFVEETDQGFAWRNFAFVTIVPKDESWIPRLQAALPPPNN